MTTKKPASGFTLMEILAALLLIGLVLPAVMKGVTIAHILTSDSTRRYEAINLAELKLDEILLEEEWDNSSASGTFDDEFNQYQWIMEASGRSVAGLKQIDLSVFWQQRGRQRQVTLSTLVYAKE